MTLPLSLTTPETFYIPSADKKNRMDKAQTTGDFLAYTADANGIEFLTHDLLATLWSKIGGVKNYMIPAKAWEACAKANPNFALELDIYLQAFRVQGYTATLSDPKPGENYVIHITPNLTPLH